MFNNQIPGQITNAAKARFDAFQNPDVRALYEQAAINEGYRLGTDFMLIPSVLSDATKMQDDTDTHPGVWVSLNADIPTQSLRLYFNEPTFIRRVTCNVVGAVIKPDAISGVSAVPAPPFEPQVLTNQPFTGIDVKDYIYAQFYRDGSNQLFQDRALPLSDLTGNAAHGYFFRPIPMVRSGGSILIDITIRPPKNENITPPPFIDRVGLVVVCFHTERYNAFGV